MLRLNLSLPVNALQTLSLSQISLLHLLTDTSGLTDIDIEINDVITESDMIRYAKGYIKSMSQQDNESTGIENKATVYNDILSQGISVIDLYIYDCLINDDFSFEDIETRFKRIKDKYSNDPECRDLSYHINAELNGYNYDEDDIWD